MQRLIFLVCHDKKKMMRYCVLLLLILISCAKNNSMEKCACDNAQLDAIVIDAGSIATDGCGWLLRVGTSDLHPINLPDSLKISQLPVIVSFKITGNRFLCGLIPGSGLQSVEIINIKRK